jgi:hypothetical protein
MPWRLAAGMVALCLLFLAVPAAAGGKRIRTSAAAKAELTRRRASDAARRRPTANRLATLAKGHPDEKAEQPEAESGSGAPERAQTPRTKLVRVLGSGLAKGVKAVGSGMTRPIKWLFRPRHPERLDKAGVDTIVRRKIGSDYYGRNGRARREKSGLPDDPLAELDRDVRKILYNLYPKQRGLVARWERKLAAFREERPNAETRGKTIERLVHEMLVDVVNPQKSLSLGKKAAIATTATILFPFRLAGKIGGGIWRIGKQSVSLVVGMGLVGAVLTTLALGPVTNWTGTEVNKYGGKVPIWIQEHPLAWADRWLERQVNHWTGRPAERVVAGEEQKMGPSPLPWDRAQRVAMLDGYNFNGVAPGLIIGGRGSFREGKIQYPLAFTSAAYVLRFSEQQLNRDIKDFDAATHGRPLVASEQRKRDQLVDEVRNVRWQIGVVLAQIDEFTGLFPEHGDPNFVRPTDEPLMNGFNVAMEGIRRWAPEYQEEKAAVMKQLGIPAAPAAAPTAAAPAQPAAAAP